MPSYLPKQITTATRTLNASDANTLLVVNRAAGSTITLPAASGTGMIFDILVQTSITSNSLIVQVANSSDVMQGVAYVAQDAGDTVAGYETAAASDTITMNGTTTGGLRGDRIRLVDAAANLWSVQVFSAATGTEATPFSAAV